MALTDVHHRLAAMVGDWEGRTLTWFDPDGAPDDSLWRVAIRPLLDGSFLEQHHHGRLGDQPFSGHVVYGYNTYTKKITAMWIDSFHLSDAMLISEGDVPANETDILDVVGTYDDRNSGDIWRWRTIARMPNHDHLELLAFNIAPSGTEDRALHTTLVRIATDR